MTYHCIICGKEVNIREEGLKIKGEILCSKCLGERIVIKSIWE